MPVGYDYRCRLCGHDWLLFSKRYSLGPVQWGETKYTCFSCQTFLSVANTVDANSWMIWYRNNDENVEQNTTMAKLASMIDRQLKQKRGLTPIAVKFPSIECPTCHDEMSATSFGDRLMKCPQCGEYSGEFDNTNGIHFYGFGDTVDDFGIGREQSDAPKSPVDREFES